MIQKFKEILQSKLSSSQELNNSVHFYDTLYWLLSRRAGVPDVHILSGSIVISRQDFSDFFAFLHEFLSIKNNRVNGNIHSIYFYCKNKNSHMCMYTVVTARSLNTNFYSIKSNNLHSQACPIKNDIQIAILISKLYSHMNQAVCPKFKVMWGSLVLDFPDLATYKRKIYGKYINRSKSEPDDHHLTLKSLASYSKNIDPSITGYFCIDAQTIGNKFYSIFSTRALLESVSEYSIFTTDGTYKLSKMDFVVIIFGAITFQGKFRIIAYSLTNNESIVSYNFIFEKLKNYCIENSISLHPGAFVTDSAPAIKTSVADSFSDTMHALCWVHITRNINRHMPTIDSELKKDVISDLNYLQRSHNSIIFQKAWVAFLRKYTEHQCLEDFINYFDENHIRNNCQWFEGYMLNCPKTSNNIEGFNSSLKQHYLGYNKQNLTTLISTLGKILTLKEDILYNIANGVDKVHYMRIESENARFTLIGNSETLMFYLCEYPDYGVSDIGIEIDRIRELLFGTDRLSSFREFRLLMNCRIVCHNSCGTGIWEDLWCNCHGYKKLRKCKHVYFLAVKSSDCRI